MSQRAITALVAGLLVVACSSETPAEPAPTVAATPADPTSTVGAPVEHPDGRLDVVIRVGRYSNANVDRFTRGPTFTLYGDGRIIVGGGLTYREGVVDSSEIDGLLRRADELGLFDPPFEHSGPDATVPDDDTSTTLYLNGGGRTVTQFVRGSLDFAEVDNVRAFTDLLESVGSEHATQPWTPTLYFVVEWKQECTTRITADPDLGASYYAWAVMPELLDDAPIRQVFSC